MYATRSRQWFILHCSVTSICNGFLECKLDDLNTLRMDDINQYISIHTDAQSMFAYKTRLAEVNCIHRPSASANISNSPRTSFAHTRLLYARLQSNTSPNTTIDTHKIEPIHSAIPFDSPADRQIIPSKIHRYRWLAYAMQWWIIVNTLHHVYFCIINPYYLLPL